MLPLLSLRCATGIGHIARRKVHLSLAVLVSQSLKPSFGDTRGLKTQRLRADNKGSSSDSVEPRRTYLSRRRAEWLEANPQIPESTVHRLSFALFDQALREGTSSRDVIIYCAARMNLYLLIAKLILPTCDVDKDGIFRELKYRHVHIRLEKRQGTYRLVGRIDLSDDVVISR